MTIPSDNIPAEDDTELHADRTTPSSVARVWVDAEHSARANRGWWDRAAADYLVENAALLGHTRLMWGPEGIYEDNLGLLGPLDGRTVLEFGAGAGHGAQWCATQGARAIASDISGAMLRHGRDQYPAEPDDEPADPAVQHLHPVQYLQCDAASIPLADAAVDVAFSAYGALPFVADAHQVLSETARVLCPGGRAVFSITHPIRWAFPDVPGEAGLTANHSYFDRTPYAELNEEGAVVYVEHHRTLGDWIRMIRSVGLLLDDLVEPEWPADRDHVWGGWSRTRGEHIPGTAIFCATKPD